ncbi:hypothetical protein MY3296_003407 [Beauveria thailandica]
MTSGSGLVINSTKSPIVVCLFNLVPPHHTPLFVPRHTLQDNQLKRRDTATTSAYLSRKTSKTIAQPKSHQPVVPFSRLLSAENNFEPRSNTCALFVSHRHPPPPTAHPRIHLHTVERQPRRRGSTNPAFAVTRNSNKEASPAHPTAESSTQQQKQQQQQQHHYHHHQAATAPSSSPSIIPRAVDDSIIITNNNNNNNNNKMAPKSTSAEAAATATATTTYYMVPNLRAIDPSAREVDLGAHAWVRPIVIEDDDLMFGGKSLSTLYEEERRRQSTGGGGGGGGGGSSDEENHEEERRGRERVRRQYSPPKSHRK